MSQSTSQNASPEAAVPGEDPRLTPVRMTGYAAGDVTVNTVLVSLNMVWVTYFLTQVAGLRPELAGLVQLIGRAVDAFTDPAMGRLSDLCRWKWGRRRPFFVLGALPLGISFALLWMIPTDSQLGMFAYYTGLYVLLSVSLTMLSVPYLALLPEMALGYDARTRLNMFRNVGSIVGIAVAIAIRQVARGFGGGPEGYVTAGLLYGLLIALPWLIVYATSWERPDFQSRGSTMSLADGVRLLLRHQNFRKLTGLFICSRISMDLVGAMLILYFTFVMGRSSDFEWAMGLFLGAVLLSLPIWGRIATRFDKSTLFVAGAIWWMVSFLPFLFAEATWPRWLIFVFPPLAGVGFAVVDLMAWSMLGDVVDEDGLITGERREGIYSGAFMFVRKLAGSLAVFVAFWILAAVGYHKDLEQSQAVTDAIREITALGPALFLALSIWIARGYLLTRTRHAEIRSELERRAL